MCCHQKSNFLTACSWTSGLHNCEKTNLCCFSRPVYGVMLWEPELIQRYWESRTGNSVISDCWLMPVWGSNETVPNPTYAQAQSYWNRSLPLLSFQLQWRWSYPWTRTCVAWHDCFFYVCLPLPSTECVYRRNCASFTLYLSHCPWHTVAALHIFVDCRLISENGRGLYLQESK